MFIRCHLIVMTWNGYIIIDKKKEEIGKQSTFLILCFEPVS